MQHSVSLKKSILLAAGAVLMLWWVFALEFITGISLRDLGVYPRHMSGAIGIVTAPFVHGSLQHLTSNSLPILLLGSMLHYGYPHSRWRALIIIWAISGTGVWLFARQNMHIGASGITHGMFFFLFTMGAMRRDTRSLGILMIAFFMYGTMLLTIFPREPGVSYEYHFFGAVGGVLSALLMRRSDPKPARKVYSWEMEGEEEEDPIIGDEWRRDDPPSGQSVWEKR